MVVFCYHNGALGHTTAALIDCCTLEGGRDFPPFYQAENLHHYSYSQGLYKVKHPDCNIPYEKNSGNKVVSASSQSAFGRLLILLMGLKKWIKDEPELDRAVSYKQYGDTYGEQLEIISLTIRDKVKSNDDWFLDANCVLDIVDYWNNIPNVVSWIKQCGFTPDEQRVNYFCRQVASINQAYYDKISFCTNVVNDVINGKNYSLDLSFYEVAMCHAMLLERYKKSHCDVKLLRSHPTETQQLWSIFNN